MIIAEKFSQGGLFLLYFESDLVAGDEYFSMSQNDE